MFAPERIPAAKEKSGNFTLHELPASTACKILDSAQSCLKNSTPLFSGKANRHDGRAFTLIELLVVIAIIVILASVMAFNYIGIYRNCMKALDQAFGCETSATK